MSSRFSYAPCRCSYPRFLTSSPRSPPINRSRNQSSHSPVKSHLDTISRPYRNQSSVKRHLLSDQTEPPIFTIKETRQQNSHIVNPNPFLILPIPPSSPACTPSNSLNNLTIKNPASVSANCCPKQTLGPPKNGKKLQGPGGTLPFSSHRPGLNSLASSPQRSSLRCIA